jgi:hypothetical protein
MATMKHIRDAAAKRALRRHRPEKTGDPSEIRPGDEDYEAHMDAKSKTREGEEDFTGHKDQDSHTRPGEKDYTGHKGDESKSRPGDKDFGAHKGGKSKTRPGEEDFTGHKGDKSKTRPGDEDYEAHKGSKSKTRPGEEDFTGHKGDKSKTRPGHEDYEAHKGTKSKTHEGKDYETPHLKDFYGKGPGKNYIKPGGDPYSYRLYDDGSIEIIAGPSGVGTILREGRIHDAIKKSLEVETSDGPGVKEDVSMSEKIEGLQPDRAEVGTFVATEEDEFDEQGNLIPSRLKKARDQRMLDQITGMGPDRSKSLYALAEKLLGTPRS